MISVFQYHNVQILESLYHYLFLYYSNDKVMKIISHSKNPNSFFHAKYNFFSTLKLVRFTFVLNLFDTHLKFREDSEERSESLLMGALGVLM